MGLVDSIHLPTADELLKKLLPLPGSLWSKQDSSWIFRGQSDASWELSPSAFRPSADKEFSSFLAPSFAKSPDRELRVVEDFCSGLDRSGLEVPGDHALLRQGGSRTTDTNQDEFPRLEIRWMFALAQHYGIPTRLLDWSYSPLVACYFAALNPAREPSHIGNDKNLAIWALSSHFINNLKEPAAVRLITVPTISNPNLHAQRGLFTIVNSLQNVPPKTINALFSSDEILKQIENSKDRDSFKNRTLLYKITLPHKEARKLLHKLHLLGIDRLSLFPGHQSAADVLRECTLYRSE